MNNYELIKNSIMIAMEQHSKIYIHAIDAPGLDIGSRGLTEEELERGIILAFGVSSCVDFELNDLGVCAKLKFSGVWEDIFIPFYAIIAVLDDLKSPSFVFNFRISELDDFEDDDDDETNIEDKIIKINFDS